MEQGMTEQQAIRMALAAMEKNQYAVADTAPHRDVMNYNKAITALRQALAEHDSRTLYREGYVNGYAFGEAAGKKQALEQADEPVAWMWYVNNGAGYVSRGIGFHQTNIPFAKHTPLYTRPQPAAQWVGLTNVEIGTIAYNVNPLDGIIDFAKTIEATLRSKNT